jgi:hypothetical protein
LLVAILVVVVAARLVRVGCDRLGVPDSIVRAEPGELFGCSRARGTDLLRHNRVVSGPVVTADPAVGYGPVRVLKPGQVDPPTITGPHPVVDCPDEGIAVAAPLAGAVLYHAMGKGDVHGFAPAHDSTIPEQSDTT